MTVRYLVGDVFDRMAELEDGSIDLVVTSPPFLALRSYLPADHPDKGKEIGSEPTPAEFIDTLLAVTVELRRVLAPHGSIAIELGDTYSGAGGENNLYTSGLSGGQYLDPDDVKQYPGQGVNRDMSTGWPLAKSKTLIPELFRIALAYGFNPLTGAESPAGKWRVRNVVTWCRPNPPVGALGDKWRPATSDVVVACVSGSRYWDDLATRRPVLHPNGKATLSSTRPVNEGYDAAVHSPSGAPLLDYWEIPPTGYKGSHYAVFPPALVVPLVKAMCPARVCVECGEPSRRISSTVRFDKDGNQLTTDFQAGNRDMGLHASARKGERFSHIELVDGGYSDCGHDTWRKGIVLDPFAGSGTTLMVAHGHDRDTIGIDLDERNAELARERVGPMFLEVEQ